MGKMNGKVVLITGGGKGIGFGIATAFAKEGANLVITGRTVSRLENAQKTLEAYGVSVLPVAADGGHEDEVKAAVRQAVDRFGKIDVLINN
ncbi:MAG: SDR family NAD(P)-dependent oxidoreductase, partial [Methanocorpusculum sp.]|nr:SDR family NAD(P)-dependent oxidoreductase [Methanocorpusculum sp.]